MSCWSGSQYCLNLILCLSEVRIKISRESPYKQIKLHFHIFKKMNCLHTFKEGPISKRCKIIYHVNTQVLFKWNKSQLHLWPRLTGRKIRGKLQYVSPTCYINTCNYLLPVLVYNRHSRISASKFSWRLVILLSGLWFENDTCTNRKELSYCTIHFLTITIKYLTSWRSFS